MSHRPAHVPKSTSSRKKLTLSTANTVGVITVPGTAENHGRPRGFMIWFEDGSGTMVRGRLGIAGGSEATPTCTDSDEGLGEIPSYRVCEHGLPPWAKRLFVASNTANAICFVTWLYE